MADHSSATYATRPIKGFAGSLDGFAAVCSACGYEMRTSLSVSSVERDAAEHIRYMATREAALVRRCPRCKAAPGEPCRWGSSYSVGDVHKGRLQEPASRARCESGWTGDRCTRPLGHSGRHSNE